MLALFSFPVCVKMILAWCEVLVLCVLQRLGLVPCPAAWQLPAVPAHLQCGAVVCAVSCSLPGSASTGPVCLTDAVEQLSLPLGRRQNESPALISLCLAISQTLKLPVMGRK